MDRFDQGGKPSSRALLLPPASSFSSVLRSTTPISKLQPGKSDDNVVDVMESYLRRARQGTLMTIAVAAFSAIFNIFLAKRLPMFEGIVLFFHVLGFFSVRPPAMYTDKSFDADAHPGAHPFVGARSKSLAQRRIYPFRELWRLAYHGNRLSSRSAGRILGVHWCRQRCSHE